MPSVKTRKTKSGATRFYVRFRADGRQTTLTWPTRPPAEAFARDCEARGPQWAFDQFMRAEELAGEPTLSEWAERHFAALTSVSPATLENYRRDWHRRWQPHLGHFKLSQVTREDIARALKAQTGADKTIANAWGTLASMFKAAVLDGHIDRSPCQGVKLPKRTSHERVEHRYLTVDELQQMLADTPERYRPLVWMLAGTGMRWSEATALTVADINPAAGTVAVTKAWKRNRLEPGAAGWYVGPPKTAKSRRTVTLPNEVLEAVEPLLAGRRRTDLLFTNRHGGPVRHQTFYREHWVKHCTVNLAAPRPRIHDLRHSHVAWLVAAGVSLPVIQARLGHEKITTTIDVYGHLMPDLQVAAADAASRVLGGVRRELA